MQVMKVEIFQILSDQTRMRALVLMAEAGALCVCELAHALDIAQPKVSRHMAGLRKSCIVTSRRDAQWVFYSINGDMPEWQKTIVEAAIEGNRNCVQATRDRARLQDMKDRPDRCEVA